MRGIVVCVDYDDLLQITLVRNAKHLEEVLVITSPQDERTKAVARSVPNARLFETDAFYRYGAKFNKGLAIEEGFEYFGREGWLLVFDADIVFPSEMPLPSLQEDCLYTATRRMLLEAKKWSPTYDWRSAKGSPDRPSIFPGYFHLFHAKDPAIAELPWYDLSFVHAGGGDGYFQSRWKPEKKIRLPFEVLHLGPNDTNWFGRASNRVDGVTLEAQKDYEKLMEEFLRFKGWRRPKTVKEFKEKLT